jgi:hypothetical protein
VITENVTTQLVVNYVMGINFATPGSNVKEFEA